MEEKPKREKRRGWESWRGRGSQGGRTGAAGGAEVPGERRCQGRERKRLEELRNLNNCPLGSAGASERRCQWEGAKVAMGELVWQRKRAWGPGEGFVASQTSGPGLASP
ncbi:hypothetical protein GCM10010171_43800 [Actinokineospora fastidiosa]|uniref:Uncharacterized protein n=1 Tax=Actinokineospora fastidiosa TaxID=1816 RepID=A0A918GLW4_9PSEU|nr:hypothetical protein GCM10010171_43800 [Actinokineospora fastidiosa]